MIIGRNQKKLQAVCEEAGKHCKAFPMDITNFNDLDAMLEKMVLLAGGKIDGFVNNAGIVGEIETNKVSYDDWDCVMDTILKGAYFITRYLYNIMAKQQYGNIVMICSVRSIVGGTFPYTISKAGLMNFTEGLAKKGISAGVRVNGICPSDVLTEIADVYSGYTPDGNLYYPAAKNINRLLLPDEIAEVAAFLISDASKCITGQMIYCDGGYTLR